MEHRVHASAPVDAAQAHERLVDTEVPEPVVDVCRTLAKGGHAAVLVGGAVRDALLLRPVADWDVATSATPAEVRDSFRRTIPTGIEHGTITVLVGGGEPVEVTTFRGEGAYEDGRRPSAVEFLRSLHDDLARRDLTVNALAWDPVAQVLTDPFGGLSDLRAGVVRAVGEPLRRFTEDGLRTMRAVRFCATLQMRLDDATRDAIPGALHVLDKVSAERVHVELTKLLCAPQPSLGLWPMAQTGIWEHVLPRPPDAALQAAVRAVDAMPPEPTVRLARLLRPVRDAHRIAAGIDALKPSRAERATVIALTGPAVDALQTASDAVAIRRAGAQLGRDRIHAALSVLGADDARRRVVAEAIEGAPLTAKELAIKGGDLIAAKIAAPGPALGQLIDALWQWALDDPARNERQALIEQARVLTR